MCFFMLDICFATKGQMLSKHVHRAHLGEGDMVLNSGGWSDQTHIPPCLSACMVSIYRYLSIYPSIHPSIYNLARHMCL